MNLLNKIGNIIGKVVEWIVYSSANPDNISLTLKALIPCLIFLHIGTATTLGASVDAILNLVVLLGTWLTGGIAIYGAARKVINTVKQIFIIG